MRDGCLMAMLWILFVVGVWMAANLDPASSPSGSIQDGLYCDQADSCEVLP